LDHRNRRSHRHPGLRLKDSMMARVASFATCSILSGIALFAQDVVPLPEGNAYVRGLLSATRLQDNAINDYTYDVEDVREDLDKNGKETSREARRYEVYFVKTRPVR